MVLIPDLTAAEKERHKKLLIKYASDVLGVSNPEIEFIGNGREKGIYGLTHPKFRLVAAAATRDPVAELFPEYIILRELHKGNPERFPKPLGHWVGTEDLGDMYVMSRLPGMDLAKFKMTDKARGPFLRQLAYKLGFAIAETNAKTGRYMSDSHDGNIMIVPTPADFEVRFVDAWQWKRGDLEEAVRSVLGNKGERPECTSHIQHFYKGLVHGMTRFETKSQTEAEKLLGFVKAYNPIF